MGTSRDIAGALNFNSGLVPLGYDAEPERIRFSSTEAKTPAQKRREAAEAEAGKKGIAKDDDMSDMGMTGDPPISEAQRKAMFAAKSGNSTLGIPQSVGAEFANADPGGKLPKHAKDTEEGIATKLYGPQTPDGGPGGPDNAVKVHDKVTGYEPRKGRWGGRVGHSHANDGGPGLETAKAENNESGTGNGEVPAGRRGGRASPHLVSGQSMDCGQMKEG